MELKSSRPAWLEIDLKALENNYKFIRSRIKNKSKIAAVVKADAYGHGAVKIAKKLENLGVEYFCVGSPDEGVELRSAGIDKPILVLAEVLESQYEDIVKGNLIQTAASKKTLKSLNKYAEKINKNIKVHLKIDTGMGRIGFFPEEILDIFELAQKLRNIEVEGIFSHFARADEYNKDFSYQQLEKFKKSVQKIKKKASAPPLFHIANSAAVIDLPETSFDLVRPGIMLYGMEPSQELKNENNLQPLLSFKTRVVEIRKLPAGFPISYGSTYKTKSEEKMAVLPVGYKDGYPRLLSNKGEVLINNKRAPIRGKICMGQTIVSIDHLNNVEIGDEVVLIGSQGDEEIKAAEIAELCGTINYEIICNLSDKLEKKYLE